MARSYGTFHIRSVLLIVFTCLTGQGANAQALTFQRTDIPTGTAPQRVAVADFNRDGIPDIVVLNSSSSSMSVVLSNGDGTFRPPITTPLGAYPRIIAVGDVNLDGFPDVVTDDADNNLLYVMLGKGDGTFQAPIRFSGAGSGIAIGDFNGDGKPDLAVTDFGNGKIDIWLGHGDGTFSNQSSVSVGSGLGSGTNAVVASDLNRDGKLDLVAVNMDASSFSVAMGNGDGTFKPTINYPIEAASAPQALAVADINGDGVPDVVVAETGLFKVAAFLGNGDGSFRNSGYFSLPRYVYDVAIGDVNGDGKPDVIAATNRGPSFATILLGNKDGTFGAAQDFAVDIGASSVAAGDFNRDGKIDIVTADSGSTGATVLLNTTIFNVGPVNLSISRTRLNFGYISSYVTSAQTVSVTAGVGIVWTASSDHPNVTVSPASGIGTGRFQVTATPQSGNGPGEAVINVSVPGALASPLQIQVTVTAVSPPPIPFGSFDTPINNTSGIAGAVAVTGWALDNIEVANVGIWREPVPGEAMTSTGLVFIGNANFVADSRPDVAASFPSSPLQYRGGWGYMLLTNFLPNSAGSGPQGNGTYKLHAIATNESGAGFDLGTRTIMIDNAHASKPFGTIDTPDQGGSATGNAFVNFGWALTQNPFAIPIDGSTITVILDGVAVGHPTYNQFRSDIASLFPGLANSNGAVGFFFIDTTTLSNGVHTISWNAFDNDGRGDGLGSRYFSVLNANGSVAAPEQMPTPESLAGPVLLRTGYNVNAGRVALTPDALGAYSVEVEELGRIELSVGGSRGYLMVDGASSAFPLGSTLKDGVFHWQVPVAFLGKYELLFEQPDGTQIPVHVQVVPKRYSPE